MAAVLLTTNLGIQPSLQSPTQQDIKTTLLLAGSTINKFLQLSRLSHAERGAISAFIESHTASEVEANPVVAKMTDEAFMKFLNDKFPERKGDFSNPLTYVMYNYGFNRQEQIGDCLQLISQYTEEGDSILVPTDREKPASSFFTSEQLKTHHVAEKKLKIIGWESKKTIDDMTAFDQKYAQSYEKIRSLAAEFVSLLSLPIQIPATIQTFTELITLVEILNPHFANQNVILAKLVVTHSANTNMQLKFLDFIQEVTKFTTIGEEFNNITKERLQSLLTAQAKSVLGNRNNKTIVILSPDLYTNFVQQVLQKQNGIAIAVHKRPYTDSFSIKSHL